MAETHRPPNDDEVRAHSSRVIAVQRRIEPWKHIPATSVDVTQLFSLRENAIAKEPGSSYFMPWRCVSRLGLVNGGLDSLESSPDVTLSRGGFSASSLATPTRRLLPGSRGSRW